MDKSNRTGLVEIVRSFFKEELLQAKDKLSFSTFLQLRK